MPPARDQGISGSGCSKCGRVIVWVSCITIVIAVSPAMAAKECVGRWRVSVEARSGTCQANEHNRIMLIKEDGRIVMEKPSVHFDVSGNVSACRTVSIVVAREGEIAKGHGEITGATASGTWTVTRPPARQCAGTWFARKR
jgi:hypothetical protein